jgi:ABC-type uncharacterized transport system fused permease/ATPase subunit
MPYSAGSKSLLSLIEIPHPCFVYLPQKPYFPVGPLHYQVTYPLSFDRCDMKQAHVSLLSPRAQALLQVYLDRFMRCEEGAVSRHHALNSRVRLLLMKLKLYPLKDDSKSSDLSTRTQPNANNNTIQVDSLSTRDNEEETSSPSIPFVDLIYILLRLVSLDHLVDPSNREALVSSLTDPNCDWHTRFDFQNLSIFFLFLSFFKHIYIYIYSNPLSPLQSSISLRLSGGEQQRLSFARLLFHLPQCALLDESTSAVNPRAALSLYSLKDSLGIQAITVAHNSYLKRFHNKELMLSGDGGYKLLEIAIDENEEL